MTYDYKFTLHFTKKHRQTKLHDRQIPIYRKVPGSIKTTIITIINIYVKQKNDDFKKQNCLLNLDLRMS